VGHFRGYTTLASALASTNDGVFSDVLELGASTNAAIFIKNLHATYDVDVDIWVASAPRSAGRNAVAGLDDDEDWYRLLDSADTPATFNVPGDSRYCINLTGIAPQFVRVAILSGTNDESATVDVYGQVVET